ncbi:hypothetical protein KI387_029689, partial [Taxus chinensis]
KKVKEVKQEPIEEETLLEHSKFHVGTKKIIVLSENEDDEMEKIEETPKTTIEMEKEGTRTEPPSLTDSSVKEILE